MELNALCGAYSVMLLLKVTSAVKACVAHSLPVWLLLACHGGRGSVWRCSLTQGQLFTMHMGCHAAGHTTTRKHAQKLMRVDPVPVVMTVVY